MKSRMTHYLLLASAVFLLAGGTTLMAQDRGGRGSGDQSGRGGSQAGAEDSARRGDDRGGRGNRSPEDFRKMMDDRMREQLKATDEEWTAIQPLLSDVRDKQRALRGMDGGSMMGMFGGGDRRGGFGRRSGGDESRGGAAAASDDRGGRGGRGSGDDNNRDRGERGDRGDRGGRGRRGGEDSPWRSMMQQNENPTAKALRETLASENAKPEEIKSKLTAFRKERSNLESALKKSREALREAMSPRQEAQLVLMGILD